MWPLSLFPAWCWLHFSFSPLTVQGPSQRVLGDPQQSSRRMQQKRRPNNRCQQCSRKVSRALRKLLNSAGSHRTTQWNEMPFFFFKPMPSGYHGNQLWFKNMILVTQGDIVFLNKKRRISLGKTVRNIFQEATSNFRKQHKLYFYEDIAFSLLASSWHRFSSCGRHPIITLLGCPKRVFCNIVWKKQSKLFGHPNILFNELKMSLAFLPYS